MEKYRYELSTGFVLEFEPVDLLNEMVGLLESEMLRGEREDWLVNTCFDQGSLPELAKATKDYISLVEKLRFLGLSYSESRDYLDSFGEDDNSFQADFKSVKVRVENVENEPRVSLNDVTIYDEDGDVIFVVDTMGYYVAHFNSREKGVEGK